MKILHILKHFLLILKLDPILNLKALTDFKPKITNFKPRPKKRKNQMKQKKAAEPIIHGCLGGVLCVSVKWNLRG